MHDNIADCLVAFALKRRLHETLARTQEQRRALTPVSLRPQQEEPTAVHETIPAHHVPSRSSEVPRAVWVEEFRPVGTRFLKTLERTQQRELDRGARCAMQREQDSLRRQIFEGKVSQLESYALYRIQPVASTDFEKNSRESKALTYPLRKGYEVSQ